MAHVDVHAHYMSSALLGEFRSPSAARLGVEVRSVDGVEVIHVGTSATNQQIPFALTHEEERLAVMDQQGIDVQVVSGWMQLNGYHLPPETGRDLCRIQNDAIADLVARHPDRFEAAGAIPMQDVDLAVAELDRVVTEFGMASVQLGTHVQDRTLHDPSFDRFWAAASEAQVVVLLHPFDPPGIERLRTHLMEMLVGFPAETTYAATGLLLSGVMERHPSLTLSLPHGGGFLPYQLGRVDHGFGVLGDRAGCSCAPSELLENVYFDSLTHDDRSLRLLIDVVGADHVLLGSDYPFNLGEDDPIARVDAQPHLADDERQQILGGTASRLLRIDTCG